MMKTRVMESVHDLLQQSGQSVPAKHLSIGKRSIQIYDVEHWPESFNSLLLHDIPSIVISIDSSTASLSGFVVTLHWKPSVDMSQCVGIFVHCLLLCCVIVFFVNMCWGNIQNIEIEKLKQIRLVYAGVNGTGFGAHDPPSILTDELRAVISQGEL
jgi:hypothetical protein